MPVLRVYRALQDAKAQLRQSRDEARMYKVRLGFVKTELRSLRTEFKDVHASLQQRERELRILVAPLVEEARLTRLAREHARAYRHAEPFPYVVLDNLVDAAALDRVLEEFELLERGGWHHTDSSRERKWSTEDPGQLGPFAAAVIAQLNGGRFVRFLEDLTGIKGLLPDPHLRGGGLHEIRQGGLLGIHADFNIHKRLQVYRRLNLLIYLNKDWERSWGGALELWDRGGQRCVREIEPLFNRAVLFDTSNFSYHGHPRPLECPPERSRKSLAMYYYSAHYPFDDDRAAHGTVFLDAVRGS